MTDLLIAIPLGLFYFIAALVCGFYFLRRFSYADTNILSRYGLSITCGLGVLGFLWSILAAIPYGMQGFSVLATLCFTLFLSREDLSLIFNDVRVLLKNIRCFVWPSDKSLRWLILPLLLYLLMAAPLAFHPLGTDALAFYFAQAKLIAYAKHFVPLPEYESFAQIPLPAELNYSALILLGSEWAARLVTSFELWACTLLMAGFVYGLDNKNIRRVWLSVFLLLTSTGVTLLVSDGKTDLYGAMLGFAVCYLSLVVPLNLKKNIILLGVLVGFAFTAKLSYVPILVPMVGLIVFARLWRENDFKKAIKQSFVVGLIFGLCIIIAFVPNVAKNYMAYGEPLAPFMFFHPNNFPPFLSQSWFSPEITKYILSIYPLALTYGQFPMQHGNLSPYVWAALPAFFLLSWKNLSFVRLIDNKAVLLALAGVAGMLVWVIFYPSVVAPRYVFPALFAFIPIASIGLDSLWTSIRVNKWAHIAFVVCLFCASSLVVANDLSSLKRASRNILQGQQGTHLRYLYFLVNEVESKMPTEGRLFLAAWERALFNPKTINCLLDIDERTKLSSIKDSLKYWETLHSFGTRVVLVNIKARKDIAAILDPQVKPEWLKIDEKQLSEDYRMYVIVPASEAPQSQRACLQKRRNYYQPGKIEENI